LIARLQIAPNPWGPALHEYLWDEIIGYLDATDLASINRLNKDFKRISQNAFDKYSKIFPLKFRSIDASWDHIALIKKKTVETPSYLSHDFPKDATNIDVDINENIGITLASDVFDGNTPILTTMKSIRKGGHRFSMNFQFLRDRICRCWQLQWHKPFSDREYRVFQLPSEAICVTPGKHSSINTLYGDCLVWTEEQFNPLVPMEVGGLIVFAKDDATNYNPYDYCLTRFNGYIHKYFEPEFDPTSLPSAQQLCMPVPTRWFHQLGIFNVFDGKKYILPLLPLWEAIKEVFPHAGGDNYYRETSAVIVVLLKIGEFAKNTPTQILLQVRIRYQGDILLMVWDFERNACKWKKMVRAVSMAFEKRLIGLAFSPNAMLGYVTRHATIHTTFIYVIRDWETGNVVQEIDLTLHNHHQWGIVEYVFSLTSFVFITHAPRELTEWWESGQTEECKAGTFHVFSISTGQLLYRLKCPAHIPDHFQLPVLPYFSHTDESERYWFFQGVMFSEPYGEADRVWVWDVVKQRWSVLGCKHEPKFDCLVIDERGDGPSQWRLEPVLYDFSADVRRENRELGKFSWRRSAKTWDRYELQFLLPKLETVGDDLSRRFGWRDGISFR
jgi:hypothetical protein